MTYEDHCLTHCLTQIAAAIVSQLSRIVRIDYRLFDTGYIRGFRAIHLQKIKGSGLYGLQYRMI